MSEAKEPAPRPGQQPVVSGNSGKGVQVNKKVQNKKEPADEAAEMREQLAALTKRIETLGATPAESGELEQIKNALASLQSRMSSMESFGARGGQILKEYGGPKVKIKVLSPIRLPRDFALPDGVKRTPPVGTVLELPEELVKLFDTEFKGQFDFSGERHQPDQEGAPSQVTRTRHRRIARLVEGQPEPEVIPQATYGGRIATRSA